MSKTYEPIDDEYLQMLLDDCNYSIENEEDFADGGPPIAHWRAIIMELQEYRAKNKKGAKTL